MAGAAACYDLREWYLPSEQRESPAPFGAGDWSLVSCFRSIQVNRSGAPAVVRGEECRDIEEVVQAIAVEVRDGIQRAVRREEL